MSPIDRAARKALVQAYKTTRRPAGIYRIRNMLDDRCIVVSSRDLHANMNRDRAQLRLGCHRNRALQADWKTLGEKEFAFEVLQEISPPDDTPDYDPTDDLALLEALWLERLEPFGDRGYMVRRAAVRL